MATLKTLSRGKKIMFALLVIMIGIQFIRPVRNISTAAQPNDIFVKYSAPDSIKAVVKSACYDCHSNNTRYPWYTNIQPLGLWMEDHVDEGKRKLNFSEFLAYPAKKASKKIDEMIDEVKKKDMPLSSYTWIHKDAALSDKQRQDISAWADFVEKKIEF